jgi:hypothetical protein
MFKVLILLTFIFLTLTSQERLFEEPIGWPKENELSLTNFCFDTSSYKTISSWSFTKEENVIKSAIFYEDEQTLVLRSDNVISQVIPDAYIFEGLSGSNLPFYSFENNMAISISNRKLLQQLLLCQIDFEGTSTISRNSYTLPEYVQGRKVRFLNEDPILLNDSTLILQVYYPDLVYESDPRKYYEFGWDVILHLDRDSSKAKVQAVIGDFPDYYRTLEFRIQDFFVQRIRVGDSVLYSFKNYNDIIVFDISDINSVRASSISPSNPVDVEPIALKVGDDKSGISDKKLYAEPGFLAFKYLQDSQKFVRIYKKRSSKSLSEQSVPLYHSAFTIYLYDIHFNLEKEYLFAAGEYRAFLMGNSNFAYLEKLLDKDLACPFYELKL